MLQQINKKIDKELFKRFRPIFSIYLKRGFFISSKELNGDLEGLIPGESEWIIDWFKESFEGFYENNLEKHLEIVNENGIDKRNQIELLDLKDHKKASHIFTEMEDKTLLKCPECKKEIHLSDLNLKNIEKGKLIDCIVYHSQENGSEPHGLMMYLDQHLNLRGKKVIKNITIQ